MVGAVRNEKMKHDKVYERKVRFRKDIGIPVPETPMRELPLSVVAAAELHQLEKRRSVSATRLNLGRLRVSEVDECDKSSAKYPTTPVRRRTRLTKPDNHPVHSELFKLRPCSFDDFPSSPTKAVGNDFLYGPGSSYPSASRASEGIYRLGQKNNICRCAQLEQENYDLRVYNEDLERKNKELWAAIDDMRDHMSRNGIAPPGAYDADTELDLFDHTDASQSASTCYFEKTISPAPSLCAPASTPSPIIAEAGTPIISPAMPIRVIDEDYDGDENTCSVQAEHGRIHNDYHSNAYAETSMEHTMDILAADLDQQMKLDDAFGFDNITTKFIRDTDFSALY